MFCEHLVNQYVPSDTLLMSEDEAEQYISQYVIKEPYNKEGKEITIAEYRDELDMIGKEKEEFLSQVLTAIVSEIFANDASDEDRWDVIKWVFRSDMSFVVSDMSSFNRICIALDIDPWRIRDYASRKLKDYLKTEDGSSFARRVIDVYKHYSQLTPQNPEETILSRKAKNWLNSSEKHEASYCFLNQFY